MATTALALGRFTGLMDAIGQSSERTGGVAHLAATSLGLRFQRGDWVRFALVPVFVVACYLWSWMWLRSLDCAALVWLLRATDLHVLVSSATTFSTQGIDYRIAVSCTAMDALMGAIPLLWSFKTSWTTNVLKLGLLFAAVTIINLVRLWLGFALLHAGVPWVLGHEAVAGVFYFGLLAWIARERQWLEPAKLTGFGRDHRVAGQGNPAAAASRHEI